MIYLLDTNVCIVHLRSKGTSRLSQRLRAVHPNNVRLCSVVYGELLAGAYYSGRTAANLADTQAFLKLFTSLPFNDPAADQYARLWAALEAAGQRMKSNDLMIASIALLEGLTLVTHDVKDFSRVPGLRIDDWQ
jgi:tRNA(fMet)-specific endonuclease VapC